MSLDKVKIYVDKTDVENRQKVEKNVSNVLASYPNSILAEVNKNQMDYLRNQKFQLEAQNAQIIKLRTVEFDTSKEIPSFPENLKLKEMDFTEGRNYWIVQFVGPVKEDWKEKIKEAGAKLYDYIPENAFLTNMDSRIKEKVEKFPFVNWVGSYEPAYKINPLLMGTKERAVPDELSRRSIDVETFKPAPEGNINVVLHDPADLKKISEEIENLGGMIITNERDVIRASLDLSEVDKLANMKEVKWIEPYVKPVILNDVASGIIDVQPIWNKHGLDGDGQIVAVADTGLDTGVNDNNIHADFRGRIVNIHDRVGDGASDVNSGHGTHVTGSVLGNGSNSNGNIRGMAFASRLVFQSIEKNSNESLAGIPADLNTLFQQAYDEGARIHTNSWGATTTSTGVSIEGQYTTESEDIDEFIWNHKDMAILFAAANSGRDSNKDGIVEHDSMSVQASAKNCISVGASENDRSSFSFTYGFAVSDNPNPAANPNFPVNPLHDDLRANNPDGMAAFSSRGPTDDGRIKPDVVAPGTFILSTLSSLASAPNWSRLPTGDPNRPFYRYMSGTSMATPITTGTVALIRQYLVNACLHSPTAALLKAILIHGAHPLTGQYTPAEVGTVPDNDQGWGRVNLQGSIFPEYPVKMEFKDESIDALGTGENKEYIFTVVNTTVPLRATLVWTDFPSTPSAGGLVNTLRLSIIAPSGSVVQGNPSNNNVQQATVNNPQAGTYKVRIEGVNVPHPKQDFALVVGGGLEFTDVYVKDNVQDEGVPPSTGTQCYSPDIWVNLDNDPDSPPAPNPEYGQTNYVFVKVHNRGSKEAQNAEVKLYWANPGTNLTRPYWKTDGIKVDGVAGNVRTLNIPSRTGSNDGEAVTAAFEWTPPDPQTDVNSPGHFCFFATVNHPNDPILQEDLQFVRWEDNLAWKNVVEQDQYPNSTTSMEFYIAGLKGELATADINIDRSSLPNGGSVKLKIPTRYLQDSIITNLQKVWESEGHKTCKMEVTSDKTADINGIKLKANENTLARLEVTLPENTIDGEVYPVFVEQKVNGTTTGRVTLVARTVKTPAYIANPRTGEIHYPDCEWVDKMSDRNKVPYNDLDLALKRGYNGCRFCLSEYSTD